jgi:hypothetical protein
MHCMLSKNAIMQEWRNFVQHRDTMTLKYVQTKLTLDSAPPNSPEFVPLPPGSPARAEATLLI